MDSAPPPTLSALQARRPSNARPALCRTARRLFSVLFAFAAVGGTWALPLAKFEPPRGCYIGAFVDKDDRIRGDYREFERLSNKKHASYFTYVGYGRPFPKQWVANVTAVGAAPHLALEPNEGLEPVKDDDYLRRWARDAYDADCPVFLRFASEMNGPWSAYCGNPPKYRAKFRLVHDVMEQLAPNVAMVWTPFAVPKGNIRDYYPGDEYVDWVGVNIYSVYVHDGDPKRPAANEDPIDFLRFIYNEYSDRKPIQISEFAATHFCRAVNRSTESFAVAKMRRFYETIASEFTRVKMVNWFSFDSLGHGIADNNYSLTANEAVLKTYRELVAGEHFLSEVPYDRTKYRVALVTTTVGPGTGGEHAPGPGVAPGPGGAIHPQGPSPAPPPLPDMRPPAPTLLAQGAWTESDWLALLSTRGANATQRSALQLRGIRPGEIVEGNLELLLVAPTHLDAHYAAFRLDGAIIRLTNVQPFRCPLTASTLSPGRHEVVGTAIDEAGQEHETAPVPFQVRDMRP